MSMCLQALAKEKEIPFKQWLHDTAEKLGITPHALEARLWRGKHPKPRMRIAGRNNRFVKV